ncbi:MAG: hypothetical protein JJT96_11330 [Opitutales bacterium]|nr:hypothetical protein [Opitutales bacterium]
MFRFRLSSIFLLSVASLVAGLAHVQGRDVYWAGSSFIGEANRVSEDFPHISAILQEKDGSGASSLEVSLFRHLEAAIPAPLKTVAHGMANLDVAAPLVMTCAFDLEQVRVERLRDLYRISVLVSAQLLVVDFETMMIESAQPVLIRLIDVSESEPSPNHLQQLVRAALVGNDGVESVFSHLADRARSFDPRHRAGARVRVANVDITHAAAAEGGLDDLARVRMEHNLAYQLGKFLSENTKIPVVPYSRSSNQKGVVVADLGHSIGARMTAVFANGDVYSLSVPSADFEFHVQIERLIKQEHASSPAATTFIYGLLANVELRDAFRNQALVGRRYKYGRSEVVSQRLAVAQDEFQHAETVWAFFDSLSQQFLSPDARWAAAHDMEGRRGLRELQQIKSYLDRCR